MSRRDLARSEDQLAQHDESADRRPPITDNSRPTTRRRRPATPTTEDQRPKQMRPRPATWTALVWRSVLHPFPRTRHGGEFIFHRRSAEHPQRCTRQIAFDEARFVNRSAALRWPAARPAVCGGLCEEAATPGQPVARRNAFWRNPPGNSPSRIARNRRLCRNALAGHSGHLALNVSTVRLARARIK